MSEWASTGTFAATSEDDTDDDFYAVRRAEAAGNWDHEFCADSSCGSDCPYWEPDTYGYRDR